MFDHEDQARQERARARRASWSGGVVALEHADAADFEFWQSAPGGVRLQAVWELAAAHHGVTHDSAPGLSRSTFGTRPL